MFRKKKKAEVGKLTDADKKMHEMLTQLGSGGNTRKWLRVLKSPIADLEGFEKSVNADLHRLTETKAKGWEIPLDPIDEEGFNPFCTDHLTSPNLLTPQFNFYDYRRNHRRLH